MSEGTEEPIYRIICCKNTDYSLASRGGNVVFALTNPSDRYQHWIKDERHGTTIKDSEGQPAFCLVNRATGEAIRHCPTSTSVPLVKYNVNFCNESVLWTMSKHVFEGFSNIRRVDNISVLWTAESLMIYDGHIMDLSCPEPNKYEDVNYLWNIVKVLPSTCISFFRPSQNTVKIICHAKDGYNLSIDKDSSIVLLVPSNPRDKFQHWMIEMVCSVPVKDAQGYEAFALVNKATGKAIKHGFGNNYLVQVALFNRNHLDPSLLWTQSISERNGFGKIRLQNNISLAFSIFDGGAGNCPLLGLSETDRGTSRHWKIEDFE